MEGARGFVRMHLNFLAGNFKNIVFITLHINKHCFSFCFIDGQV